MTTPSNKISKSLADIAMLTGDGYKFLKFRAILEKWEKEGLEGNLDSQKLVDLVYQFERLLKVMDNS